MTAEADRRFLALALALGARGLGRVWPNPAVGCVLVRDGQIVGRGWTQPGGRPHAETEALARAGNAARGSTAYVSLEPCAHQGRTPPCATALVAAGVSRVVTGCVDPDPRVAGKGHAMLRQAGIAVTEGLLPAEARAANQGFFLRIEAGRPLVTLKLAMSADGRIADAAGASRWITGPEARRRVHAERARHDAVMVGIGTALADDPDLRVRDMGTEGQPVRVVLDSRLRLPPRSRLALSAAEVPVWVIHGGMGDRAAAERLAAQGVRLLEVPADERGRIDAGQALRRLADEGLTRVFCEGGGTVAASLLAADCVDHLMAFHAGRVFGASGTPAVGALTSGGELADPAEFRLAGVSDLGGDVLSLFERRRG